MWKPFETVLRPFTSLLKKEEEKETPELPKFREIEKGTKVLGTQERVSEVPEIQWTKPKAEEIKWKKPDTAEIQWTTPEAKAEKEEYLKNVSVELVRRPYERVGRPYDVSVPKDTKEGIRIMDKNVRKSTFISRADFDEEQEALWQDLQTLEYVEVFDQTAKQKRWQESVPIYGALDIMGRGLASPFLAREAQKMADAASEAEEFNLRNLLPLIEDARKNENWERHKKLLSILEESGKTTARITNQIEDLADLMPQDKQIIAASAELALLASFGYGSQYASSFHLTARAAKPTATLAANATTAAKLAHYGTKYAINSVQTGTRIGIWSAAGEAKTEESTVEDIIAAGERGLKFGLWLGPAFTASGDLLRAGIKHGAPHAQKFIKTGTRKLERIAQGKDKMPKTALEKSLEGIEKPLTFQQKTAKTILGAGRNISKAEQKLVDRFVPIRRIENKMFALKGGPLSEKEKVYRDIRTLNAWADGLSEKKTTHFINQFTKYSPAIQQKARGYLNVLSNIDRVKLGYKVPGDKTLPQLKNQLAQLMREIGPEDMKQVAQIRRMANQYNTSELLGMVKAGLIDTKQMNAMLKAHPNYIPHSVAMNSVEKHVTATAGSMDVSKTTLHKAVGSVRDIKDPIDAMLNKTFLVERIKQKNILMNSLIDAQKQYGVIKGAEKIATGIKAKDGFTKINLFNKGVKETWQVPDNIASSIKGTDVPVSPAWWRTITAPTRALKKGATTYNPGFVLRNKFRDEHQAALLVDSWISDVGKKYGFTTTKNYSYKQLNAVYKKGGWGASIFQDGEDAMRQTLMRGRVGSTFDYHNLKALNPFAAMRKVNLFVEQSTRKEVLAKALASGIKERDAVFISRMGTVDFSRMGEWMRVPNQAIPFLNARVQGLSLLPEAFLKNPDRFTEAAMNTSVLPTLLLHQHNRRFESYKYINQGVKDLDWIIMTGEVPAINPYTGDEILVPQFINLKRGEGQSLVSAPIRHWLEKEDGIDHRKVSQMLADMFGSNSPVDFGTYSRRQQNIWGSIASQFGPVSSMIYGGGTGKHPYWGTDIVPEHRKDAHKEMQFAHGTPEILKEIPKEFYRSGFAETFNVSPGMIDFYVSVFGGMPQDVLRGVDLAYGVVRDGKMGGLNVTETTFETLTEIPIIRGFLKQRLGNVTEADRILISDVEKDFRTDDLMLRDRENEVVAQMRTLKTPTERRNYFNQLGDELTPELLVQIINRSDVRTSIDGLSAITDPRVRARIVQIKVKDMQEKGHTDKAIWNYLQELLEAKILDRRTIEEMLKNLNR